MPGSGFPDFQDQAHLVIVDDEEMVLTSIGSLLKLETNYRVDRYTDPVEALTQLRQNSVDLVMADYLMPTMDGIEFLAQVKDMQPEVTRILLTGYADKESAIKSINHVNLFQYIQKPWDNSELLLVIRNGLEKRFLMKLLREKVSALDEAHSGLKDVQKRLLQAFI